MSKTEKKVESERRKAFVEQKEHLLLRPVQRLLKRYHDHLKQLLAKQEEKCKLKEIKMNISRASGAVANLTATSSIGSSNNQAILPDMTG